MEYQKNDINNFHFFYIGKIEYGAMMKKISTFLLSIFFIIIVILGAFEWTLSYYHTSYGTTPNEPQAHQFMWLYLLKQQYHTLIDLDILTIHEKRHLLDVKRALEAFHLYWLLSLTLLLFIFTVLMIKFRTIIHTIMTYSLYTLTFCAISSLFILFDFLDTFKLFHELLFISNSWIFPEQSYLIQWFPLIYFKQFFVIVFLKTLFMIIFLYAISSFLRYYKSTKFKYFRVKSHPKTRVADNGE